MLYSCSSSSIPVTLTGVFWQMKHLQTTKKTKKKGFQQLGCGGRLGVGSLPSMQLYWIFRLVITRLVLYIFLYYSIQCYADNTLNVDIVTLLCTTQLLTFWVLTANASLKFHSFTQLVLFNNKIGHGKFHKFINFFMGERGLPVKRMATSSVDYLCWSSKRCSL